MDRAPERRVEAAPACARRLQLAQPLRRVAGLRPRSALRMRQSRHNEAGSLRFREGPKRLRRTGLVSVCDAQPLLKVDAEMMTRSVHSTRSVPSGWPPEAVPRYLSRECAAFYLGMSPTHFDSLVRDGILPPPRKIGRRSHYDRQEIDAAMARITRPDDGGG